LGEKLLNLTAMFRFLTRPSLPGKQNLSYIRIIRLGNQPEDLLLMRKSSFREEANECSSSLFMRMRAVFCGGAVPQRAARGGNQCRKSGGEAGTAFCPAL
jgi:hypothetical protein